MTVLRCDKVSKSYGNVAAVVDATLEVREGEVYCIMGLSGSGKSTLVRCLNRLIVPTSGSVWFRGRDMATLNGSELREVRSREMGMVFQNVALLPHRKVIDNVAFGLELRGVPSRERAATAREAMELVRLTGWEQHYPDELSGGMKQRVGIARAVAAGSKTLLMDEPFSALDPLIRRELQDQLKLLIERLGMTVVFITHDFDEALRIGDRMAIMRSGRIVQQGTPQGIVREPADDYVAAFTQYVKLP